MNDAMMLSKFVGMMIGDGPTDGDGMMDEVRPETTGQRIFWLRRYVVKLLQKELADRLEISAGYLSELEADKKEPSAGLTGRIADALNTTTDFLLCRTDDPSPRKDAEPSYISEEADKVARLVDDMADAGLRGQAVAAVRGIHEHYQEHAKRDRMIRDLLASIEATSGPVFRRDVERKIGLLQKGGGHALPLALSGNGA